MLIITRKPTQSLTIHPHPRLAPGTLVEQVFADSPIRVQVLTVLGSEVRIGVAAHPGLCVLREELLAVAAAGSMPVGARKVLARKLRVLKVMQALSSERLARMADLPLTAVMAAESGAGMVYLDDVEKLARVLGVGVRELFREPGATPEERVVMTLLEGGS